MPASFKQSLLGRFYILWSLSLLTSAAQADFEAGKKALEAGDYTSALAELQPDARQGHAGALFQLGRMYEKGMGVPRSARTAVVLYRVSYLQGNAQAEAAVNRVANTMAGGEIAEAVQSAAQLQKSGRFVPALPGAPPASSPPPVPAAAARAPSAAAKPAPTPPPPAAPTPEPAAAVPAPVATSSAAAGRSFELKYTCAMQLKYQDRGSGGRYDIALYQPQPEPGYYLLGGYAQNNYDAPNGCTLTIKPAAGTEAKILSPPAGWERVWKDKGTGATMDGSIWRAVPRSPDYVCLGQVGQTGKSQPLVDNYACVNRCLVQAVRPTNPLWTTESTGAASPIEVYILPHINSFIAVPGGQKPDEMPDLNRDASCF